MGKGQFQVAPRVLRYPLGFLLAVAFGLTACAPKGEALYDRAAKSLADGEPRAAVIDLKNLVKSEPENARARALLAQALIDSGEFGAGEIELQKAKDLGAPKELLLVPQCRVLVSKGDYAAALEQCDPDAAPADAKVRMLISQGAALAGLDRPAEAKVKFQKALATQPDNLDALLGLASATYKSEGMAAAQAVLDGASEAIKQRPAYWLAVGGTYLDAGNPAAAEKAFSTAVAKAGDKPDNAERLMALGSLAEAQMRAGKVKEATATTELMIKAAPNSPFVKQLRGQVAAAAGDYETARKLLEEVVTAMPDNYHARMLLGMVQLQQGNLGQAEMNLASVVAHQPGNVQAQKLLAETRSRSMTPEATLESLQPVLQQEGVDPSVLAMAGRLSLASGDREGALAYLAQAEKQAGEQQSPQAQLEIAAGYVMAGDLDRAIETLEAMPASGETNVQRENLLMLSLIRKGETDKALAEAKALLERSPKDPAVRNLVGAVYSATGQRDAAREQFNEALKLDPKDSAALLNLARLDLAEGKVQDAEKMFRRILDGDPKNLVATLGMAATTGSRGETKESEKWLQKAVADHPDAVVAPVALAQFYIGTGDFGKARDVVDGAAKKLPANAALSNARGMALLGLKDVPGAIASFKAATEQAPGNHGFALNLARAHLIGGDLKGALEVVNGVLKREPKYVPALVLGAAACLRPGGDLEKATGYVERLQQAAPDTQVTYAVEGDLAMAQKRYRDAQGLYRKANQKGPNRILVMSEYRAAVLAEDRQADKILQDWIAAHPDDAAAVAILAESRQRGGDVDGAIRLYEQALAKAPGNAALLNNLAVLYQAKGDPRALALAEQAYKAAPKSAAIQDTYGWILLQEGRTDEATTLLAEAAKAVPDAEVQYHYAAALAKQGRKDEAMPILKKALAGQMPAGPRADAQKLQQQLAK